MMRLEVESGRRRSHATAESSGAFGFLVVAPLILVQSSSVHHRYHECRSFVREDLRQ